MSISQKIEKSYKNQIENIKMKKSQCITALTT